MTRLIFTCLVLLFALGGVQYAIWSSGDKPVPRSAEQPNVVPAHHQDKTIYRLQTGEDGKLYWVKIETRTEV